MGNPISVLILEDRPADAELMIRELRRAGFEFHWKRVDTEADFAAALERVPDVILADYALSGFDVRRALAVLQERGVNIPLLVVTGSLGDEAAAQCIKLGAVDYLLKDRLARLPEAITEALEKARLREEQRRADRALQKSERLKDAIIRSALDCVVVIDREGKIVEFNPAAELTFHLKYSDVLGKPMADLIIPPRLRDAHHRGFAHLLATGEGPILGKRIELAAIRADGTEFPIELTVSATGSWETPSFTAYIRDITERIQAEISITRLNRVHAVLSGINTTIVRVKHRQELFDEACRIAVEHGKFGMAWIGMVDWKAMDVTSLAWAGPDTAQLLRSPKILIHEDLPEGRGLIAKAVKSRLPAYDNDIAKSPDVGGTRRTEAIGLGYRSFIALPLVVEARVVGVLSLFAKEADFFNVEELKLLTELAGDISFALEHLARQEKLEKLSRIRAVMSEINAAIVRIRDRQALFDEACRIAAERGKFSIAWIGTRDRASDELRPAAWVGLEADLVRSLHVSLRADGPEARGTIARAIRGKQPVWENDFDSDPGGGYTRQQMLERGFHSAISLPLLVDGEVDGAFVLYAKERGFFTDDEVGMLSELAADVSFALQGIAKQERLDYLSYYDALTGLPNRMLFVDRASQQMRTRGGEPLLVAMVLLNLERFRNINETFGRNGGDALLNQIAGRLEGAFHGKDYLARIAADSFGVLIRGVRAATAVAHAVEGQVLGCFREPYHLEDSEVRVAARAGIAVYPADGSDSDSLFRNAEAALKKARESGERYLFYAADMNARAAQALSLETRLRRAVEAHEFVLHFQPKFDLAHDRICGLEALTRWQEPGGGLIAPGTFIPLLEETGLIVEVGQWAIAEALKEHRDLTTRGCRVPRIAVNVSAIQLQQKDFADSIMAVIRAEGDNPDALELEVTESLLMKDIQASIHKLSVLRGLGVTVAMDDFGTGYSSLSYLARLPISSLKIDRSFVGAMAGNPQDMSIVTTIIALAHSLNLRVVAEGVETADQAKLLKLLKCDEAQGFLFSKPLPAEQLERLLVEGNVQPVAPAAGTAFASGAASGTAARTAD
jgi:diguanylate cyclase (GGDEF)-like protein/PAS domain S-box-containing protein